MKRDIQLTPEGDLMLGQQKVDEEGFLLYYDSRPLPEDGLMVTRTAEGNLPIRDMNTVEFEDYGLQLIKSRVQTDNPDWILYPEIGANLSDLIGELNTPETGRAAVQLVLDALTHGGAFLEEDLHIDAIPVSESDILLDIQLKQANRFLRYAIEFNLEIGLMNAYELKESAGD